LTERKWLYIKDIHEELGVHEETVRTWIRQGKLIAYKVGRDYRIKPEDYEKFLEDRRTKPED
jgi:excisionase family DNA binding protein